MEATTSCSLVVLPPKPFLSHSTHKKVGAIRLKRLSTRIYAERRDANGKKHGGGRVDEDMIVLRMRIHDMKMEEANYEAPSNWMEWEKKYYANYDSDVCEAVGLLQTQLMNTRPSFVIGMAVLLVLSVTTSTAMVCSSVHRDC
ncbi:hypothetical protein IFM89_019821 [Coptis chinensis]|uniref:Uncharacterized protein n=1 Tax=Coptis chinensis TaxID=261450 RepID=A0A835M035_9MAGN|nr:hypothetical protein IFM89_019821 [Coptis chinensis]